MNSKCMKISVALKQRGSMNKTLKSIVTNYELYLFTLPAIIAVLIFCYIPMYGVQIAFKDFIPTKGIMGSEWIGFDNFQRFFHSYYFTNILKNTLRISIFSLIVGFPIPIILALLLNELNNRYFKSFVQTITYAPHFISMVVMTGMIIVFLSPSSGFVNHILNAFGHESIYFTEKPGMFPYIYVLSGIWQNAGWSSVLYFAALAGIDTELYEAAKVDGATRLQKILYINIPGISSMIIIMLIMTCGNLMSVGFEKTYLLQNNLNIETSEVISTYVYKVGLQSAEYGFATAVGLFNSVINFVLLVFVNSMAKRYSESSLW